MLLKNRFMKSISSVLIIGGLSAGFGIDTAYANDSTPAAAASNNLASATSDATITADLKTRLMKIKGLTSSDIHVTTTDGTVVISGTVRNTHARSKVTAVARNIDGVKHVTDNLTIARRPGMVHKAISSSENAVSDSWITSKVKSELLADNLTKGFALSVATQDGVVTLQGHLSSQEAINRAEDLAKQVKGVKRLDTSALIVSAQQ